MSSYCSICNRYREPGYGPICECEKRYQEEIAIGKYPPGLTEDGKQAFGYPSWRTIKLAEVDMHRGLLTLEQAQQVMQNSVARCNDWLESRRKLAELKNQSLY